MSKLKAVRHGEIMLVPVTGKVAGVKYDSFIVGHSETGHHHVLESSAPFVVQESSEGLEFLVELFEPAKLVHKKTVNAHRTLEVAPGKYKVVKKTEYNPWTKLKREVFD